MSDYSEKLKDPRWQKIRLKALERDDWRCQVCGDKESTLHVHHKVYVRDDPWDTSLGLLMTTCELCHKECFSESEYKAAADKILFALKGLGLTSHEVGNFASKITALFVASQATIKDKPFPRPDENDVTKLIGHVWGGNKGGE